MTPITYETHKKLYLLDGNIALFAPRSPGHFVVFRVHQSVLARISPVFESMFTLPTGPAEEKYDGVPLLYLPDSADAVENLLMIVYHESYVSVFTLRVRTSAV
jgi:BTB/POZ domain